VSAGANLNDFKLCRDTFASIPIERPKPTPEQPQHLCPDKGYDYPEVYELAEEFAFTAHVRSRGEEQQRLAREAGFAAGSSSVPTPGSTASAVSSSARRSAPTPAS
jgi:putative transposase